MTEKTFSFYNHPEIKVSKDKEIDFVIEQLKNLPKGKYTIIVKKTIDT